MIETVAFVSSSSLALSHSCKFILRSNSRTTAYLLPFGVDFFRESIYAYTRQIHNIVVMRSIYDSLHYIGHNLYSNASCISFIVGVI